MAKNKKFSVALTLFLAIACLAAGCAVGFLGGGIVSAKQFKSDEAPRVLVEGELQIHFLELGNKYTGDCTYIKAGETDILIDAGSKTSSIPTISEYLNQYVTDGKLEYVIVTHAHEDHYAGFSKRDGSLFDLFEIGTVIDFARTNQKEKNDSGKTTMYGDYQAELSEAVGRGATHYKANECIEDKENKNNFDLGSGITLEILDSYFYYNDAGTENDYSVCSLFTYGDYQYLFTGDLEEKGEKKLVEMNELSPVNLYKGGHHGSKTSSSDALLSVIKPEIVCVCCCAGSPEYTKTDANQFPTQEFVDRIAPYTDRVYVTSRCIDYKAGTFASMNGNITVVTDKNGLKVICSADDRVLKEWEWFKEHRQCPAAWKPAA